MTDKFDHSAYWPSHTLVPQAPATIWGKLDSLHWIKYSKDKDNFEFLEPWETFSERIKYFHGSWPQHANDLREPAGDLATPFDEEELRWVYALTRYYLFKNRKIRSTRPHQ